MYSASKKLWPYLGAFIGLMVIMAAPDAEEIDPVLHYYWSHAQTASPGFSPVERGLSFSFKARSYRKAIVTRGAIGQIDSIINICYYSGSRLDSLHTVYGNPDEFADLDYFVPSVFETDYHLNLFPNDPGGPRLAIGLLADSAANDVPDGLVTVDRREYYPHSLYLCWPSTDRFHRRTRSFRFKLTEGVVFPDSIWEITTRLGIFSPESFRLETGITEFEVTDQAEQ